MNTYGIVYKDRTGQQHITSIGALNPKAAEAYLIRGNAPAPYPGIEEIISVTEIGTNGTSPTDG